MGVSDIVQGLCWVGVGWLLAVHVLVERGRLPAGGTAYRVAGCAAAAAVVAAAVTAELWPVIALGILWLRTEVFAHRPAEPAPASAPAPAPVPAIRITRDPSARPRRRSHRQLVDVAFRLEILTVAVVIAVLLSGWVGKELAEFDRRTDSTLCGLIERDC